jgi:hypothetical protein
MEPATPLQEDIPGSTLVSTLPLINAAVAEGSSSPSLLRNTGSAKTRAVLKSKPPSLKRRKPDDPFMTKKKKRINKAGPSLGASVYDTRSIKTASTSNNASRESNLAPGSKEPPITQTSVWGVVTKEETSGWGEEPKTSNNPPKESSGWGEEPEQITDNPNSVQSTADDLAQQQRLDVQQNTFLGEGSPTRAIPTTSRNIPSKMSVNLLPQDTAFEFTGLAESSTKLVKLRFRPIIEFSESSAANDMDPNIASRDLRMPVKLKLNPPRWNLAETEDESSTCKTISPNVPKSTSNSVVTTVSTLNKQENDLPKNNSRKFANLTRKERQHQQEEDSKPEKKRRASAEKITQNTSRHKPEVTGILKEATSDDNVSNVEHKAVSLRNTPKASKATPKDKETTDNNPKYLDTPSSNEFIALSCESAKEQRQTFETTISGM